MRTLRLTTKADYLARKLKRAAQAVEAKRHPGKEPGDADAAARRWIDTKREL